MAVYLDTSAAVKLLVEEDESSALAQWLAGRTESVSSALLRTEIVRTIRRRLPERLERARRIATRVTLVAIDDEILNRAGDLEPRAMRSLDAIHLATALRLADDLDALVTYDRRMIEAARALGLPVASPT